MSFSQQFDLDVGTYLKVIRFHEPPNADGFAVLYLRPAGRFLLAGYWAGYEPRGTWMDKLAVRPRWDIAASHQSRH